MRGVGQRAPSEDDGSRAPNGGQAPRSARALALVALAIWGGLVAGAGGYDAGGALTPRGATAAAWALALGAPAAAVGLALAGRAPALRSGPARLALGAVAGTVAWTALSILWAPAPDLAWIAADRAAIGLAALVLGLTLGAVVPRAPEGLAAGLLVAAAPSVAWALGTKLLPGALGEDGGPGRLSAPLDYPNALALVCALALPGTLWLATRRRTGAPSLAAAVVAALALTGVMTLSRSGAIAAALAGLLALAVLPRPRTALAAGLAGLAGAAWPAAFALTHHDLTADGLPAAAREAAGAGLAWRLAAGVAIAAALAPLFARAASSLPPLPSRVRRPGRPALVAVAATGAILVAVAAALALGGGAADGGAVGNESGRLLSAGDNGRRAWWGQAARGAVDAPLAGNGGGSFALVHLRERTGGEDAFRTREAHQMLLGVLSDLGAVGLGLTLALLAAMAWGVVRARRRRVPRVRWLPMAVLVPVLVQAQLDWTWSIPAIAAAALAAAGVLVAHAADPAGRRGRRAPGPLAAVAVAGVAAALVAAALLPWLSLRAVQRGEAALAEGRATEAVGAAAAARSRNPLALEPLFLRARALAALGDRARALGAYAEMTRRQPDNPRAWTLYALALGEGPRADAAWRRVRELNPRDARAAAALG